MTAGAEKERIIIDRQLTSGIYLHSCSSKSGICFCLPPPPAYMPVNLLAATQNASQRTNLLPKCPLPVSLRCRCGKTADNRKSDCKWLTSTGRAFLSASRILHLRSVATNYSRLLSVACRYSSGRSPRRQMR